MMNKQFFIPKDIAKKIADATTTKDSSTNLHADTVFREKRNYYLKNKKKKEMILFELRKAVVHKETRRLFDCKNEYDFSDDPLMIEQQIHSDKPSQNEVLQLANMAYDFYHDKYNQESFDGKSSPIDVYVNFGQEYNNAFYDGLRFVFGNGDGVYFRTFLLPDIFMHEFTHGVTDYKCGLKYEFQSGALNEHYSDVFAMCLKQRLKREKASDASWIVGERLFTDKIDGKGIRSFKNEPAYDDPILGRDEQPKHMKDYQNLPNTEDGDYGGVHVNSGIPNHAFYNLCMSAEEVSDEWNYRSWKYPLEIWYSAYNKVKPNTNFLQFAKITFSIAVRDHPELQTALFKAWQQVGITL